MSSFSEVLSSFDDYPVHQTSRPISHAASGDLNHYDRYFFNGYTSATGLFFALAMGLYPNRHVADAAFSVVVDGGTPSARQVNVHASRRAPNDRADANEVGPIRVEVLEPLRVLHLHVDAPEHGLRAELTFERRSAPIEEPHFHHQVGMRVLLDYSRLTQFGSWSGWIEVDGERVDVQPRDTLGTRDRSWGIRPVGERGSTGAPVADPQFYWLWAPINFGEFSTHFDVNERFDGRRWHESGFVAPVDGDLEEMRSVDYRIRWRPGTRAAAAFEIDLVPWKGEPSTVLIEPRFDFQMLGVGYSHPEWGHGVWKGELATAGDRWPLPVPDPLALEHLHVQTVVSATTSGGLGEHEGVGVLEQFVIGRHTPTGLEGFADGWSPDDAGGDSDG
jgi:hypothetical protein